MVGHRGGRPGLAAGTLRTDLGAVQGKRLSKRRDGLPQIQGEGAFLPPRGKWNSIRPFWKNGAMIPLPKYTNSPKARFPNRSWPKNFPTFSMRACGPRPFSIPPTAMIPWLREIRPDPIVEIHPDTAQKHGIEEGHWVYI